jgi:dipeptidyl aminopeptidase/acylaminoacyl peptidase
MNRELLSSGLAGLLAFSGATAAQEKTAADAAKLLTPAAALNLRSISDLQFSPDGARVAFVLTEPPKAERRARHIWLYEKKSGAVRQFTFSPKDERRRAGRQMGSNWRFFLTATSSSRSTSCTRTAEKPRH